MAYLTLQELGLILGVPTGLAIITSYIIIAKQNRQKKTREDLTEEEAKEVLDEIIGAVEGDGE